VSEQRKDEVTSWAYLPGGHTPLTQTSAHGVSEVDRRFYAIVTDHLDTPVAMLDPATGALAGRASSTAWGQTTWVGEASTPWRFPGQYADPETGLHYNVFRYYRPQAGRYLSPDPLGLAPAPNPYAYPPNPTALVDPWGLAPCPHPNRGVYDVYGETRLPRDMWLDSDPRQFQEANRQLYHQMRNDPALMARIEQSYPGTFEHVTPRRVGEGGYPESAFSRKPPPGLTWHHHEMPGLMRLVDRLDHNARHGDYHPTGRGGRAIWGGGSDNR
jgi:RHS repeat-associated protein